MINVYGNEILDLLIINTNLERIIEIGKENISEALIVSESLREDIIFSLCIENYEGKINSNHFNNRKLIRYLDEQIHYKVAEIYTLLLNNSLSIKIKAFIKTTSLKFLYHHYPLSHNFIQNYI